MADLFNLTEDEQKFFETGELPPALQAEHDASLVAAEEKPAEVEAEKPAEEAAPEEKQEAVTQPEISSVELQLQQLRQSLEQEQRVRMLLEQRLQLEEQQKAHAQEVPPPNPETDPLGAMMHQLNSVNKQVSDLQVKLNEQHQAQEQQKALLEFQTSVRGLRDEFMKTAPDFLNAYEHLRGVRSADMKAIGVSDAEIAQALARDEFVVAQNALQSGKNPAALIYEMAKRHGYAGKTAAPTAAAPAVSSKLEAIKAGQEAAKGAQSAAGAPEALSVENLKHASEADLDRLVQDDKAWNKITGGKVGGDIFHR